MGNRLVVPCVLALVAVWASPSSAHVTLVDPVEAPILRIRPAEGGESAPAPPDRAPSRPEHTPLFFERNGWVPYAAGAVLLVASDEATQKVLVHALAGPLTLRLSRDASKLGEPAVYMGAPVLLYAFGGAHGRDTGRKVANALVTAGTVTQVLKFGVGRMRPDQSADEGHARGPSLRYESFPSGHTSAAFAVATVMAGEYPKWRTPIYLLATAVAVSRVLQDKHFPSDVFVGAGIGIAAGQHSLNGGSNLLGFRF